MPIQVMRPSAMPAAMVDRWRALHAVDERGSPFLSPDWALAVEAAHGEQGGRILAAVATDSAGRQGFMAVRAGPHTAMAVGAPLCDYQGVVGESGLELDARALVQALGVGRLDFTHVAPDQAAFAPFAKGARTSWIVEMEDGFAAYAAARRAQGALVFKDLGKKRRKAAREAGEVVFEPASSDQAAFEQLFAWKQAQLRATGQADVLSPPWTMRLMRELFGGPRPGLAGCLFTLRIGGELAAAHFHLAGASVLHAWMIAHDARFERYSPGMLLFADILAWMDGGPWRRLDLGVGDYRFKRQFANAQAPVMHGFVGVPSPAALVRGAAYGLCRAAETLPLGAVSLLPGKAMRRLDTLRALR